MTPEQYAEEVRRSNMQAQRGQQQQQAAAQQPQQQPGVVGIGQPTQSNAAGRSRLEQAMFDRQMALLGPQFEQQQRQLEQRLANQGLAVGSEAYATDWSLMSDAQNRARTDAANAAVMAGAQSQFGYDQLASQERMQQLAIEAQNGNVAAQLELQRMQAELGAAQQAWQNEFAATQYQDQRDLQNRQNWFNEMGWFLGGQVPMIQGMQANAPNVSAAYGNYQQGLNNQFQGQMMNYQADQQRLMAMLGMIPFFPGG